MMKYSIREHSWNTDRYCIHITDDETKTPVVSGLTLRSAALLTELLNGLETHGVVYTVSRLDEELTRHAVEQLKEDQAQGK